MRSRVQSIVDTEEYSVYKMMDELTFVLAYWSTGVGPTCGRMPWAKTLNFF